MSYRIQEPPPHLARRTMVDIATPMRVTVHNGATARLAIPCWYQEVQKPVRAKHHNVHWHHHVGWPSPNHPDHICQLAYEGRHYGHKCPIGHDHCHQTCSHYIDMTQIIPIHLLSDYEGYNAARVVFDERPAGLVADASIDPIDDWVVRVTFDARVAAAKSEPVDCRFSVFVDALNKGTYKRYNPRTKEIIDYPRPARTDVVAHGLLRILPSPYEA